LTGNQRYITELIRAWASGGSPPFAPLATVELDRVKSCLCAHNIEAALGPLLVGAEVDDQFNAKVAESRARSEFLLLECERILPVLTTEACRPVILKGAALALTSYQEPSDRWFLDLDILVPAQEVAAACARLESLGYRPLRGQRDPLFYDKYHLHRIMLGPQGAVVELHWDLTLPGSVYHHDVAGVFQRAEKCTLGRLDVLCAAPVDQLLHGVYQNIADGFVDLRRVLDGILLANRLGDSDWSYLVNEAQETGMDRALWLSLHNMKLIGGGAVPDEVMESLRPGPLSRRIVQGLDVDSGCLDRIAATADGYTQTLHLLTTPTNRQRFCEVMRTLWVGEGMLLDLGYHPDQLPGWGRRVVLGLKRVKVLMLVSWRVARAIV